MPTVRRSLETFGTDCMFELLDYFCWRRIAFITCNSFIFAWV